MRRPSRLVSGSAAVLLGAGLLLAGCGDDDSASDDTTTTVAEATTTEAPDTTARSGELTVDGVWARTSPAMTTAGAAYLQITNGTDTDDALVGAAVDASIAGTVELHEVIMAPAGSDTTMGGESGGDMSTTTGMGGEGDMSTTTVTGGGMMTMSPVEEIPVPAGETVSLAPGGYHIMLLDLVAPLEMGSTIEIILTFENAGEMVVEAEVRDTAP
jgi:copper(I)-binding protein